MTRRNERQIIVIGAGVLGLSAATAIQSRHPKSTTITIVAAELPSLPSTWTDSPDSASTRTSALQSSATPSDRVSMFTNKFQGRPSADYASMWAGAHYRPIPRSTRQLEHEFDLAVRTNDVMLDIARRVPVADCGVAVMPAVELLEQPGSVEIAMKSGDVYAGKNDAFRVLSEDELQKYDSVDRQGTAKWGCEYMTYCVNVHIYCVWLLESFLRKGGKVIQTRLQSLNDVFDIDVPASSGKPLVVNCSGRNFDSDPAMKIIRGQTVLVRNKYHRTITRQNSDGSWAFLIPRPGGAGTVIGGTKELDDVQTAPRLLSRQKLLDNAVKYFPDFVDHATKFEVLNDNVGRRPWRDGGLRIEVEILPTGQEVIHGYGAGGRGYELSWGVAEKIADLVDAQYFQSNHAKL